MPEKIEFDVSNLNIDEKKLAKDIKLDKEIEMLLDKDICFSSRWILKITKKYYLLKYAFYYF